MTVRKLGVDAGGTLIKIAINEEGRFHYKKYPVSELEEACRWLSILAQGAAIGLTGGKAHFLKKNFFNSAKVIPEFEASCEGASFLLRQANEKFDQPFLLVNIGTGTSWYLIHGEENKRVLGSGIGGGTFMGLGRIGAGSHDFTELIRLAEAGDKQKMDLLVKDIYYPEEPPIDGNLTASNFGKAGAVDGREADMAASTINMITETIILLTQQTARLYGVKHIVYIGSTLIGNIPLRNGLTEFSNMVGLKPYFLNNGEYSGALGAIAKAWSLS